MCQHCISILSIPQKLLQPEVHKPQEEWNREASLWVFCSSFSLVLFFSLFQDLLRLTRTTQWVMLWVGMTNLRSPVSITRNGLLPRTSAWEISSVSTQNHHLQNLPACTSSLFVPLFTACGNSYICHTYCLFLEFFLSVMPQTSEFQLAISDI